VRDDGASVTGDRAAGPGLVVGPGELADRVVLPEDRAVLRTVDPLDDSVVRTTTNMNK
jgi:hypothetical protein